MAHGQAWNPQDYHVANMGVNAYLARFPLTHEGMMKALGAMYCYKKCNRVFVKPCRVEFNNIVEDDAIYTKYRHILRLYHDLILNCGPGVIHIKGLRCNGTALPDGRCARCHMQFGSMFE